MGLSTISTYEFDQHEFSSIAFDFDFVTND